jgi:tetratricopeptide (TPR) repeat protein
MRNYLLILFFFSQIGYSRAQTANESQLFQYAQKIEGEGKLNDALTIYKSLLKNDSNNVSYLTHTSILYSKVGHRQPSKDNQIAWYKTGFYLAQKAIKLNNNSAEAHYSLALSLGRMNENAGSKTKIENAKQIKSEAEITLKLNPKIAGAYHILGRWHQVVAGFNAIERTMISAIFGSMPGGSYTDAINNFQRAIVLEPLNMVHYYELAHSYYLRNDKGDKAQAKNWASKALMIPVKNEDDADTKKDCEALLKKLN